MTLLTSDVCMPANQRKACDVMVEPELRNPTCRNMTRLALSPDLTQVHIVVGMAAAAGIRHRFVKLAGMTLGALKAIVTGRQQEIRFTFVVIAHGAPFEITMATTTVRAKAALVNVVLNMTRVAAAVTTIAKFRVAMTCSTGNALMTADQSEAAHRKVIESGIFPTSRTVAVGTLVTVASFVNVIGLMAGTTGTPDLCEVVFLVAGVAGHTHVPATEGEVGEFVIEFRVTPASIAVA